MLNGPTPLRHGMQSLLTSPWRSCDLFGKSEDQVNPKRHTTRFMRGRQAGAGSWTYAAVTCNAAYGMLDGFKPCQWA